MILTWARHRNTPGIPTTKDPIKPQVKGQRGAHQLREVGMIPIWARHRNTPAQHWIKQWVKALHHQQEAAMIPTWARHRSTPGTHTTKHRIMQLAHRQQVNTPNLGGIHTPTLLRIRLSAITKVCLLAKRLALEQQERALLGLELGP